MERDTLITYHSKARFRNNYCTASYRICFPDKMYFTYCNNNEKWLVFKNGLEIGELSNKGLDFVDNFF